jgi:trehalose 6-phosphate synthase/phosphatase
VLNPDAAIQAYRAARRRLLLMDYDGTLVRYFRSPEEAAPSEAILDLLCRLSADTTNCVALVSGRRRDDLDSWFGGIPGLWLAAEHGVLARPANSLSWQRLGSGAGAECLPRVRAVMERYLKLAPGSFLEEKEHSIAWHYRLAPAEVGERLARDLVAEVDALPLGGALRAVCGKKIVEARPVWARKGLVLPLLAGLCGTRDFRLAAGDDATDEDLFQAAGSEWWTIHVGSGPSCARFSVAGPQDFVEMLGRMAAGA